ncbi:hypothetical protein ABI59_15915 [Acidobacteria bacterium Mor1]|nr:hypothetical protein ABI59_15915 [Acidobacteria bacterium Mor1]
MKKLILTALTLALAFTAVSAQQIPQAGDAYTLWAVIFNAPDKCSDGVCNEDDVFVNPVAPETAVVYLSGLRVPASGVISLGGSYAVGQTYGALPFPATTIYDTETAEIHLVLRSHGKFLPAVADAQITTFGEGCVTQECQDMQFAVFQPGLQDENGEQQSAVLRFADFGAVPLAWATLYREEEGFRVAIHTDLSGRRIAR